MSAFLVIMPCAVHISEGNDSPATVACRWLTANPDIWSSWLLGDGLHAFCRSGTIQQCRRLSGLLRTCFSQGLWARRLALQGLACSMRAAAMPGAQQQCHIMGYSKLESNWQPQPRTLSQLLWLLTGSTSRWHCGAGMQARIRIEMETFVT